MKYASNNVLRSSIEQGLGSNRRWPKRRKGPVLKASSHVKLSTASARPSQTSSLSFLRPKPFPGYSDLLKILESKGDDVPVDSLEQADSDQAWDIYLDLHSSSGLDGLSPSQLERIIVKVKFSDLSVRVSRMLRIMKDIREKGRAINIPEYDALFFVFASTSRFEECWLLFQEMGRAKLEVPSKTLSMVVHFLGRRGKTLSATKLLSKLLLNQHEYSDNTHCALMQAFLMNKDLDNAMEVFRKMQQLKLEIPIAVLHSLLDGLLRLRKSRYAKEVFEAWTVAGKPITSRIYSPLIRVLVKDKLYHDAFSVFEYLKESSVNISTRARMAIIEAYLFTGRLEDSAALLRDSPGLPSNFTIAMAASLKAQDEGQSLAIPDISDDSTRGLPELLIHMYIKEGRLSDAEEMLLQFTRSGFIAHLRIYHMLMGGYFRQQQENKALEILQRLADAGLCPDRSIYDLAFKTLTKTGDLEQAKQLYSEMTGSGVAPLMTTFKYLMHMLVQGGENDLAQEVFLDVLELDIHPTSDLINIAMREFVYLGNYEGVFRFLQHAINSGVVPTLRNFGYVIDALVRSSRLEDAERVLGMVRQCNILPDVQMCTLIIQGHVRSKDMARAQKVLDQMQAWGIQPDTITYAVITRGLILSSQFSKTRDLFVDMQTKGLTPDLYNYSCLIGPHMIRMGSVDAENFLAQLLDKGIQPDGILFCLLMNAILSNLGSFELIRYARKHAATIFQFDEPLRFLAQSARRHRELLPGVAEFWESLKSQGFAFKPEHYHHYIFALLLSKEFDGAAHMMEQALESQVYLLDRTLTLIESFRERNSELLSEAVLDVFERVLSAQDPSLNL